MTDDDDDPKQVVVDADEASIDQLRDRIEDLEAEVADLEDRLARALADRQNLAKRRDREVETARRRGEDDVLGGMLPVLEALDRALEGEVDRQGVRMVRDEVLEALDRHDVEPIDAEGAAFDPTRHEAIARVPTDAPEGTVVDVVQPGYIRGDTVLRPSKVTVAGPDSGEEA